MVIFEWKRIPLTEKGRIANHFIRVLDNLLFCSEYGTKLGWLINPEEEVILVVFPEQKVKLFKADDILPVLDI